VLTVLHRTQRHVAVAGLAGLGAVAVVATIPFHANATGPVVFRATYGAVEDLRNQVHEQIADDPDAFGRIRFDIEGIGFAEPYTAPVIAELLEGGVDVIMDNPTMGRQLGDRRLAGAVDADLPVMFVRVGAEALEVPPGVRRIAFHDGERSPYSVTDVKDIAVGVFIADDGTVPAADVTAGSS